MAETASYGTKECRQSRNRINDFELCQEHNYKAERKTNRNILTTDQRILFGLAKLRQAMMNQEIEDTCHPKKFGNMATSYGCGKENPDYFLMAQLKYDGYYDDEIRYNKTIWNR